MNQLTIPSERIEHAILLIRGHKIMVDRDLADLYDVETRALLQAVRRNLKRFPPDFMFQLTNAEMKNWRSHFVMSNPAAKMGLRRRPLVFTEQGVAMLSSILKSERAIRVNIEIIRAFVKLRRLLSTHEGLARKLAVLERKYNKRFQVIFEVIRKLMIPPEADRQPIGFQAKDARRKR